jgi:outer membrane protein assembly factor BamB
MYGTNDLQMFIPCNLSYVKDLNDHFMLTRLTVLLFFNAITMRLVAQDLDIMWTFNTGDRITASPVIDNGTIYIGSENGNFYALDVNDGKERWKYSTRGYIMGKATIYQNIVFFESSSVFYALDKMTGKLLWKHDLDWPVWGYKIDHWDDIHPTAIVQEGVFYIGTSLGTVIGLNAIDGKLVWQIAKGINAPIRSTPTINDGKIYFGDWNGKVYSHDLATKELIWEKSTYKKRYYDTFGGIASDMLLYNDKLYFGARNPQLSVLNERDGEPAWIVNENDSTGGWIIGAPVINEDVLYIGNSDSHELHALNVETGEKIWDFDSKLNVYTKPIVTAESVILTAGNAYWYFQQNKKEIPFGGLFVVNKKTGQLTAKLDLDEPCFSSPAIDDGVVFFGSFDGNVYAVNIGDY